MENSIKELNTKIKALNTKIEQYEVLIQRLESEKQQQLRQINLLKSEIETLNNSFH